MVSPAEKHNDGNDARRLSMVVEVLLLYGAGTHCGCCNRVGDMTDWLKTITVRQVVVALAIIVPWASTLWDSTDWIIRPALAGAVIEVLKDEGIDLKTYSTTINKTAEDVEDLKQATEEQTKILEAIQKAIKEQSQ